MKKIISVLVSIFAAGLSFSQDTFSICAVDTVTGEVGSAGASCIDDIGCGGCGGVVIISDVHPGRGVVHTQSYWNAANQNYASSLMNLGLSPAQIRDSLTAHDAQNNPAIRQYGMVDFDSSGNPRSAAYTGANCLNYKNHIIGPNYSIQGNILLGQQILDSMQANFLNTQGDLACKLMAALQGANVVGADTRCTNSGNSSLSSFIRVAKTTDTMPNIYINLVIKYGPAGYEPIDSLQTMFNAIHSCAVGINESHRSFRVQVYPNPVGDVLKIKLSGTSEEKFLIEIFNSMGQKVFAGEMKNTNENFLDVSSFERGIYFYRISTGTGKISSGKLMKD